MRSNSATQVRIKQRLVLIVREDDDVVVVVVAAVRAGVVPEAVADAVADPPPAFRTRSASKSAQVRRSRKTVSVLACNAPTSILTRTSKRLNEPVLRVMFSTYDAENSPCQVADEDSSSRSTNNVGSGVNVDEDEEDEDEEEVQLDS